MKNIKTSSRLNEEVVSVGRKKGRRLRLVVKTGSKNRGNKVVENAKLRQSVQAMYGENQQGLLPLLELIEGAQCQISELMNEAARGVIEHLLIVSAEQLAGAKARGVLGDEVRWHGTQRGVMSLAERQLQITRPRLRSKNGKEIAIPAYQRLCHGGAAMGQRVCEIVAAGVSTRRYESVLPEVAGTVGVSKSRISRKFIEASTAALAALNTKPLGGLNLLALYMDGIIVAGHHIIAALGVDGGGKKHLLGLVAGATENAVIVGKLLDDLMGRGLDPALEYLFVIDGSKALRCAIEKRFGERAHVQRCRVHKLRYVFEQLPKELVPQVKAVMQAAYRLDAKEGKKRLEKQAAWLKSEHPEAAASLLEGLDETFTVNRLGLTPKLIRCLATTNAIENPNGIVRTTTRRVKRYRDQEMTMRWCATGFLEAEKGFRKIQGVDDLWILEKALNRPEKKREKDQLKRAA